jgi:hypothetical protein
MDLADATKLTKLLEDEPDGLLNAQIGSDTHSGRLRLS